VCVCVCVEIGGGGVDMAGELKRNERKFYFREVGAERTESGSNILNVTSISHIF
jgi:hypothetical protein